MTQGMNTVSVFRKKEKLIIDEKIGIIRDAKGQKLP